MTDISLTYGWLDFTIIGFLFGFGFAVAGSLWSALVGLIRPAPKS